MRNEKPLEPEEVLQEAYEEEQEEDKNTDEYSDPMDAIKHVTRVHGTNKELNENYLYAKFGDKQKDFILGQYVVARIVRSQMKKPVRIDYYGLYKLNKKDPEYEEKKKEIEKKYEVITKHADEAYELLMTEPHGYSILERNSKDNWLVGNVIKRAREEEEKEVEQEEEKGLIKTIMGKFGQTKETEQEE